MSVTFTFMDTSSVRNVPETQLRQIKWMVIRRLCLDPALVIFCYDGRHHINVCDEKELVAWPSPSEFDTTEKQIIDALVLTLEDNIKQIRTSAFPFVILDLHFDKFVTRNLCNVCFTCCFITLD